MCAYPLLCASWPAQRADVVAARRRLAQQTPQPNLARGGRRVARTAVERDEGCEPGEGREVDGARVGAEQLIAALEEDRALPREEDDRGHAARHRRRRARHDELVVALDAAPYAA